MSEHHISRITQAMSSVPTRRHVLRGLAALGLTFGFSSWPGDADAKKKKKKRKKKGKKRERPNPPPPALPTPPPPPTPNQYGCLSVGVACGSASECCSGLCEGGFCQGHGAGTCSTEGETLCEASTPTAVLYCNNSTKCACTQTTAGSSFCGALEVYACADCKKDTDCLDLGFPAGTACAPFSTGICTGSCQSGLVCIAPCGTPRSAITAKAAS